MLLGRDLKVALLVVAELLLPGLGNLARTLCLTTDADHHCLTDRLHLAGVFLHKHLTKLEALLAEHFATRVDLHLLAEKYRTEVGAIDIGDDRVDLTPIHLTTTHGVELVGLAGVVEREIDGVVDMPEYVNVVESDLHIGVMAETLCGILLSMIHNHLLFIMFL